MVTEDYRLEYIHRRPHSSLGCETPAAFAATVGGWTREVSEASATSVGTGSATPAPTSDGQGTETVTDSHNHGCMDWGRVTCDSWLQLRPSGHVVAWRLLRFGRVGLDGYIVEKRDLHLAGVAIASTTEPIL